MGSFIYENQYEDITIEEQIIEDIDDSNNWPYTQTINYTMNTIQSKIMLTIWN